MDTPRSRFVDALESELDALLPDALSLTDVAHIVRSICWSANVRIVSNHPPTEQDEYKRQRALGWEYYPFGQQVQVMAAHPAPPSPDDGHD